MLKKYFCFQERQTNLETELLAGITTFMTMAYIIFVNPQILNFFGDPSLQSLALPVSATMTVTCLTAGILCIAMGLFTNYPIAMAAGMGLNAVVAYQLVLGSKLSFASAMGIIVMEGIIITILVLTGFRKAVMDAIPMELKKSIGAGIGLFIAFIGFQQAGFIQKSDATLITLGNFTSWGTLVTVIGFLLTLILISKRIHGAILWGILGTTGLAILLNYATGFKAFPTPGTAVIPTDWFKMPDFSTMGHFDFNAFYKLGWITAATLIFSIMLTDFFDTMGTVIGIGDKAGLLDKEGNLPGVNRVLLIDSLGAVFGGCCSASSNTCYVESASGVTLGGRTGLASVVTGLCFLLAVFFSPLAAIVPKEATAPALIIVGYLMLSAVTELDLSQFEVAFPAFLILMTMPFTYSISNGIGFGFIAYTLIHLFTGKGKQVHWLMYLISLAFLIDFLIPLLKIQFHLI